MKKSFNMLPIDYAAKAYLLGFLACDGSVYDNKKIQLEITDESIIDMFCEITDAHYIEYSKYDKRTDKTYSGFRTYKVINDILDIYGGRLKKDRIIPLELIPQEYYSFLVQGIFDADGTLRGTVYSKNRIDVEIQIASSYNIIILLDTVLSNIGIRGYIHEAKNYYTYYIYNKYDFAKFVQYIYSYQSFLPLKRKYDKARFILNTIIDMNKEHLLPYVYPNIKYDSFKPIKMKPFYYNT